MKHIHFIGIGGIGVSALANYYIAKNYSISGSDAKSSEITDSLKEKGVDIFIGHKAKNLNKKTDLLIYSSAISQDNPELKLAKKLNIKTQIYSRALGDITKKYFTIAISGTHGKSTTTAMIGILLTNAGLDPTVIIGTKVKEFNNSNCRIGKSNYLVIEAGEYKDSFLKYSPRIIVLTNIDNDHLDYFKNMNNVLRSYKKYINRLKHNGLLIANKDDANVVKVINDIKLTSTWKFPRFIKNWNNKKSVFFYSLKQLEAIRIKKILNIPGNHNVQNALATLVCGRALNIKDNVILKSLSEYKGTWRRFEMTDSKLGSVKYKLISDYGHHPTEVKATLDAVREKFKNKRIILIFQPHQYKRTRLLFNDFIKSFDVADYVVLNEIFGVSGREGKKDISSNDLVIEVAKREKNVVRFIKNKDDILKFLLKTVRKNDVVIVMGAGDIYDLTLKLCSLR